MARGSGTRGYAVWLCAAAVALTTACGGEAFVFGTDASSASTMTADAGSDAPVDAGPLTANLLCGSSGCAGTCCTSPTVSPHCTVGGSCGTCDSQLKCTTDDNCGSLMSHCCIAPTASTSCTGSKYFTSQCKAVCNATETRLCNPNLTAQCPGKATCSSAASNLAAWGLPSGQGYGVCIGM